MKSTTIVTLVGSLILVAAAMVTESSMLVAGVLFGVIWSAVWDTARVIEKSKT